MNDIRLRQSDLIDEEKLGSTSVCVIGCGGIGSHTALALARMGVRDITLVDNDEVDRHNCSSQGFNLSDIGQSKVECTAIKCFEAVRIMPTTHKVFVSDRNQLPSADIFVLAVDSMESRKEIFNAIMLNHTNACVIDAGMGAEYISVKTYTGNTVDSFDRFTTGYFSDDEAKQDKCTAKATIYTTLLVSGFICKTIKDVMHDKPYVKNMAYDIASNRPMMVYSSNGESLTD